MGEDQHYSTHAQRSPSMSLATTWQFEMKRIALTTTILFAVLFVAIQTLINVAAYKQVTIIVDGEEIKKTTKHLLLVDLLEELEIAVHVNDRLSKPLDTVITRGSSFVVNHVTPVQVRVDGTTKTRYTIGQTVQEALQDLNITLGEEDRIKPELHQHITENSSIDIMRVQTKLEIIEESIPYDVVTQQNDGLDKGKMRLVQEGKEGILQKTIEIVFEDGVISSEKIVSETIIEQSEHEIVQIGTKNPVMILSASSPDVQKISKDGLSFGVKQVLENVTLTAYHAGYSSTGKTEEHPHYGKTYSGTIVKEGRTVAVDPKVIPLGWWVYIEGVGLRKAEDIGSAIKGKKIDVYMDSEDEANQFGRKKGNTVYVVGPTKPVVN